MRNNELKHENIISSIITGIAGVATIAVIAVAGVATAVLLRDEKNRGKLKKTILHTKEQAIEMANNLKSEIKNDKKNLN